MVSNPGRLVVLSSEAKRFLEPWRSQVRVCLLVRRGDTVFYHSQAASGSAPIFDQAPVFRRGRKGYG